MRIKLKLNLKWTKKSIKYWNSTSNSLMKKIKEWCSCLNKDKTIGNIDVLIKEVIGLTNADKESKEIIYNNLYGYMKHYIVYNLSPKYNLKINFS